MVDPSEDLPELVDDPQTLKLIPVELIAGQRRKLTAGNADLEVSVGSRHFPISQSSQRSHQDLALEAPLDQLDLLDLVPSPERPATIVQQIVDRIGKGIDLHVTTHAMHRNDLADYEQIFGRGRRCVHAIQAAALAASFSS